MDDDNNGNGSSVETGTSRRRFITTALGAAGTTIGLSALSSCQTPSSTQRSSKGLPSATADNGRGGADGPRITMAGYELDRVEGLIDGRVRVDGFDARFEVASIGKMNTDALNGPKTREVTEIGLSPFMLAYANGGFRDYVLVPVFPLRMFRHKSIFVRTDSGIGSPEDLRGRKVATAGYSSTSLTWLRGIVQHEYGVDPKDIRWFLSSQDSSAKLSGGVSKQEQVMPEGIEFSHGPAGQDESDMLVSGEVDALFHAAEPKAFVEGHPKVARLFTDFRKVERAYFAKTGIFPLMHAVAIRRDAIEAHPQLPKAVFNAYSRAKKLMYEYIRKRAWYALSLPWLAQEAEETRRLMGDNYWPYGIAPNRKALEALFQYSYEQGLAAKKLEIEEVFHPSTLDLTDA